MWKIVLIALCLALTGCHKSIERTINPIGFSSEDEAVLVDALNQWCDAVGDCAVIDRSSPNTIQFTDGESKELAGECHLDTDSWGVEKATIYVSTARKAKLSHEKWVDHLTSTLLHELGHMLANNPGHSADGSAVMYFETSYVTELTEADIKWYRGVE